MLLRLNYTVVPIVDVPTDDLRHSATPDRPTILVVHDEVLVADCMSTLLSRAGFTAHAAYDGKRALELALDTPPDLLVSDIGLRELDGIQLAMAVVTAVPTCKVLLFSSHESSAHMQSARDEGYDFPSLAKPVHPAEVMKRVMECFAGSEPQLALVQ